MLGKPVIILFLACLLLFFAYAFAIAVASFLALTDVQGLDEELGRRMYMQASDSASMNGGKLEFPPRHGLSTSSPFFYYYELKLLVDEGLDMRSLDGKTPLAKYVLRPRFPFWYLDVFGLAREREIIVYGDWHIANAWPER